MANVKLLWSSSEAPVHADLVLLNGLLVSGAGLVTAVLISLATDRRAREDDVVDGDDRAGWWADAFDSTPWGSRLWLLQRSVIDATAVKRAADYAFESLAWLTSTGVADLVEVSTARTTQTVIQIETVIYAPRNLEASPWRGVWSFGQE